MEAWSVSVVAELIIQLLLIHYGLGLKHRQMRIFLIRHSIAHANIHQSNEVRTKHIVLHETHNTSPVFSPLGGVWVSMKHLYYSCRFGLKEREMI